MMPLILVFPFRYDPGAVSAERRHRRAVVEYSGRQSRADAKRYSFSFS